MAGTTPNGRNPGSSGGGYPLGDSGNSGRPRGQRGQPTNPNDYSRPARSSRPAGPTGPAAGQRPQPGQSRRGAPAGAPVGRPGPQLGAGPSAGRPGQRIAGRPAPAAGAGATGIFPPAYAAAPAQAPAPAGYAPDPGRGRAPAKPVKPRRLIDYPRWGRTGWTRWLPSWKLISGLIGTGIILMMAALFAAYAATGLPPKDALAVAQTTVIYFNDGKTPIAQLATQNRQNVSFEQIPKHVQDAVLAAEDRTFRTNSGIEPTSIVRAAWSNVRGNSLQGGSTISQQYVKNVYDQRDRSVKRKAKEIFLAIKVNQRVSKNEILERYLNTIYLGDGAYGIQAASHAYFGPSQKVEDLTISQGAFLAGIINAPSLSDPRDGAEQKARAKRRWAVVLDAMVAENWLDPATRETLRFPKFAKPSESITVTATSQNGYLRDMVVKEAAKEHNLTEEELKTGGYKIITTFDSRLVQAGAKAVKAMLPSAKDRPKRLNIGMASIDPTSGAVRAIYGGSNYRGPDTNNATLAQAQAGSTFKAFGLIAALENGFSLKTAYDSSSPARIQGKTVDNTEEDESSGYQDLVTATRRSLNTVYVRLNIDVGEEKMAKAAYDAGIPKSIKIDNNLTNVLGSADPRAIDMASAYGTFAAEGVRHKPYTIQRISQLGTKADWTRPKPKGQRVFQEDSVADLTYALQQVVRNGTGTYAQALNRPVAAKSGTSSKSRSAWFVGYTPQMSTSVMMYQLGKVKVGGKFIETNVPMEGFGEFPSIYGGGYPARIWTEYMQAAMRGVEIEDFPPRADVGEIKNRAPVIIEPTATADPTQTADPNPTTTTVPADPTQPPQQPDPTATRPGPTQTGFPDPTAKPTDPDDGGGGGR